MLKQIFASQCEFALSKSKLMKKKLGQYLTNDLVSEFMASLLNPVGKENIRILDAGAGSGILGIAVVMHCIDFGVKEIHLDCFEIDEAILELLESHLSGVQNYCDSVGVKFSYTIVHGDFLLVEHVASYDYCSLNPPYFKSNVASPYYSATNDLFKGSPNVYASFVARALSLLNIDGQIVFITPRSFTNGFYFKRFRKFLSDSGVIEHIHIFNSRKELFKESKVLQENIIFKMTNTVERPNTLKISSCSSSQDFHQSEINTYPYDFIVRSVGQNFILIPDSNAASDAVKLIEGFKFTFSELGYCISTGPIVTYRTDQVVKFPSTGFECIPLINAHYIKPLKFIKDIEAKNFDLYALKGNFQKWLIKNQRYVLLKRISTKDDEKRINAAVYDPKIFEGDWLAIENHVNVIGRSDRLITKAEAYGLAIYLQSVEFELYYSCLSGSTQVNATDIRDIPMPSNEAICLMGQTYIETGVIPELAKIRSKDNVI